MASNVVFVPSKFGKPKKDDIYEVIRRVKNQEEFYTVKDIVWLRKGKWVSMRGAEIPDDQVKAWERKSYEEKNNKRSSNHAAGV